MSKSEQYTAHARECGSMARKACRPDLKEYWSRLELAWLEMLAAVEKRGKTFNLPKAIGRFELPKR